MSINFRKTPPFNFSVVDQVSPEYLESEKRYAEFKARLEKDEAEQEIRAAEYFRNSPHSNTNSQLRGNDNRQFFSNWNDQNYKSSQNQKDVFKDADSTPTEQVIWLIQDWIPKGELTLLIGPPNSGKNTIALAIAAALSRGDGHSLWYDVMIARGGNTMLSSTEENFASTSKQKFLANSGNAKSLININEIPAQRTAISNGARRCKFSDTDYEIIRNAINNNGNISLMILDPISQVVSGNSGNKAKDRDGYETLAQFAEDLKFSALGIGHPPKTTKGKPIYARIDGSAEAGKVARSIMMVDKIKGGPLPDGATHVMVLAKSFGAPVNYGVTYSIVGCKVNEGGIEHDTAKIVWHSIIPGSAEEILALAESGEMVTGKVDPVDVAVTFLKELLRNGPILIGEGEKQVKAAGISTRALTAAKKALCIKSTKQKGAGQASPWEWCLPESKLK